MIGEAEGCCLYEVQCSGRHVGWSSPEELTEFGLVLVRSGRFSRRVQGRESVVDPTVAYLEGRGQEQEIAHPAGGDVCTAVSFPQEVFASVWGGEADLPSRPVHVEPRIDLAHRLVVRNAQGESAGPVEGVLWLLTAVCSRLDRRRVESGRPATERTRQRLVDEARDVLVAEPGVGLIELARRLSVSPHHLSRLFSDRTGFTISRYRIHLRVRAALERLEGGDSLARIASDVGFADQAHLARSIKSELGETPARLRRLLRVSGPPG
jgi:AraC-like DNA-binding protein